jgi:chromosome segregation ATPase
MLSSRVLKRDLLENQNNRLRKECSVLKERFLHVRRRLSQQNFEFHMKNDEVFEDLKKKIQVYHVEYEKLVKIVENLKKNKNIDALELQVKDLEQRVKALEKEKIRLNRVIDLKHEKKTESFQDPLREVGILKTLVEKITAACGETEKNIEKKREKRNELEKELEELKNNCPVVEKRNFDSVKKAKEYLKVIKNSFSANTSKFLKIINDLEEELADLKRQETVLYSTLVKKEQQFRLIQTMGKSSISENPLSEAFVPDVKFFYKPTIKYLYI